jgi:hypothetical protein
MVTDKKMLDALDKIEKTIGPPTEKVAAIPSLPELCEKYHLIRPWVVILLQFIEQIPVYGKRIAAVIRFLMGIADTVCALPPP